MSGKKIGHLSPAQQKKFLSEHKSETRTLKAELSKEQKKREAAAKELDAQRLLIEELQAQLALAKGAVTTEGAAPVVATPPLNGESFLVCLCLGAFSVGFDLRFLAYFARRRVACVFACFLGCTCFVHVPLVACWYSFASLPFFPFPLLGIGLRVRVRLCPRVYPGHPPPHTHTLPRPVPFSGLV